MKKKRVKKESDEKTFAFLGILLTVIGFVIAILVKRENKYVMFYSKQGLILFIAFILATAVGWIPIVGWVFYVLVLVLWIIGLIYSLSGEMKKIPVIGDLAEKIKV